MFEKVTLYVQNHIIIWIYHEKHFVHHWVWNTEDNCQERCLNSLIEYPKYSLQFLNLRMWATGENHFTVRCVFRFFMQPNREGTITIKLHHKQPLYQTLTDKIFKVTYCYKP